MSKTFDVTVWMGTASMRFRFKTQAAADAMIDVLEMRDGTPANMSGYDVHYEWSPDADPKPEPPRVLTADRLREEAEKARERGSVAPKSRWA